MTVHLTFPALLLACATMVHASPPPPLPWITSHFSVRLDSETIDFRMDCPDGKLTRLSATRGRQVTEFPVNRLGEWALVGRCSGVSTNSVLETEGARKISGIDLLVKLSQEYVTEELRITFDPHRFEFTEAMWVLTYPAEPSQINRMRLP